MARKLRVLMTGASGRVGRVLVEPFGELYDLRPLYRQARPDRPEAVIGDLHALDVLRSAMAGADVVLHLAAQAREASFRDVILPVNIVGTYNVFSLAHEAGVRRVVFASTCHTVQYVRTDRTITADEPARPRDTYGVSKVFGEALGRYYHEEHGMEVVCIRIGWLLPYDAPGLRTDREKRGLWLSPRDAVGLFRRAVEAPDVGYALVYGTSATAPELVSRAEARDLLGFVAEDDVAAMYGSRPGQDSFQGA
jgi:uronate dehydrogenase